MMKWLQQDESDDEFVEAPAKKQKATPGAARKGREAPAAKGTAGKGRVKVPKVRTRRMID